MSIMEDMYVHTLFLIRVYLERIFSLTLEYRTHYLYQIKVVKCEGTSQPIEKFSRPAWP